MPKIRLFLAEGPVRSSSEPPFRIHPTTDGGDFVTMSRVPCTSEVICLGNDERGVAADYRVDLVHHRLDDNVAADVYASRVRITDLILSVAPER